MKIFKYSYEQMQDEIRELSERFRGALRVRNIGQSADGRRITEMTAGEAGAEQHILIQAGMHGREYLNCALVLRLLGKYLEDGGVGNTCLHVVPMVNPDGCTISQEGVTGIRSPQLRCMLRQFFRKNCAERSFAGEKPMQEDEYFRIWKANARGVDINRNFAAGWREYTGALFPGAEGYKGAAPECEAETRAILKIHREAVPECCIAYHSAGNLIYWDYGSEGPIFERDRRLAQAVSAATGYALHSTVSDGTDGAGCSDYFVLECGIPAVTIETGAGKCPLGEEEFLEIYERNTRVFTAAANVKFV